MNGKFVWWLVGVQIKMQTDDEIIKELKAGYNVNLLPKRAKIIKSKLKEEKLVKHKNFHDVYYLD